eukprot:TRINITY_DN57881_c0_g1_i1.p1 TRINITY_DN57881_c0_g1~~TRINITY_DN57881_c0_g1_i1.p1  ORF type:complete len:583 (+),score=95.66 TRINITY_DN57881_c0_g1_i1:287-2035(+)
MSHHRSHTPPPGDMPGGSLPSESVAADRHSQMRGSGGRSTGSGSDPGSARPHAHGAPQMPGSRRPPSSHSVPGSVQPNPPAPGSAAAGPGMPSAGSGAAPSTRPPPNIHEWVLCAPAIDPTMQAVCKTTALVDLAAGPVARGALLSEDETEYFDRQEDMEVVSRSVYPAMLPGASCVPWLPPQGRHLLSTIPAPEIPPPPHVARERWHGWLQALQTASWLRAYLKTTYMDKFEHAPNMVPVLARACKELAGAAVLLLAEDPILVNVQSPCYILGDIHGNFGDLDYFLSRMLAFYEPAYTPARFLFLGDYVDRGDWSVEVAALLLSFKVLAPKQFYLLRGNHEVRAVNGDIAEYGKGSFLWQCKNLFGEEGGEDVYHAFNNAFLQMPLAAVIDGHIFCAHGGIPRSVQADGPRDRRIQMLQDPRFPRFNQTTLNKDNDQNPTLGQQRQIMTDLLWADPAEEDADPAMMDDMGFGRSDRSPDRLRAFGNKAVDDFFDANGFSFMIRAHQHKYMGFRRAKRGRLLTLFSSSNYCNMGTPAAAAFLANNTMRLILKECAADDAAGRPEPPPQRCASAPPDAPPPQA